MSKTVFGQDLGCWIPIIHDGQGKRHTVMCSECQEAFRFAHENCPACGIKMMFDPMLVYGKEEKENE